MTSDTNTLFGLQWPAPAAREIRINVIMLHGDACESFSESSLTFSDDPEGHERAQFAMKALPYISEAADNRRCGSMTSLDICVAAAEEMSAPPKPLTALFSSMFCRDARYPTYLALPVAYTLEHHTEAGIQRAVFPYRKGTKHRHFKVITKSWGFDPKYLRHWA
jgi:hypothetical protein